MNPNLRAQLIRHEGLQLKPYRDTTGKLTIGCGRNLDDVGLSREEVDFLLANDVAERVGALRHYQWFRACDEVRQAVLIDMAFMGMSKLLGFRKMIAALEAQDWLRAAAEMLDSEWAKQVKTRALRLSQQMITGAWQP